ncbi:F-box protein At2g27310-like [Bidens hawaiensis]|uniref:F-box protein At2g27310-like n=1 Tax=Bidens hawaiensis TaxID=980011 RepID=UPI004049F267
MSVTSTTLSDIHSDIIQTNILTRLDGPSLSNTATASSYLNTLCSDNTLWSPIARSTWPSITHPHVDHIISTFPAGHRSFFDNLFPSLTTNSSFPSHNPSELVSSVDIRYQNDVIYSAVKLFKCTCSDFISVNLNESEQVHGIPQSIDVTVDEIVGADKAALSHLKESMTLSWIIIDPVRKRVCNLSSIKPVSARGDWVTNETHLRFMKVLPGCDPSEMVQCRICLTLGVGERGVGLNVKEVILKVRDLDSCCLNGIEFLRVIEGASMEENNVLKKVVDDDERLKSYMEFKKMKRERKEWVKKKQINKEVAIDFGFVVILLCFYSYLYFVYL